MTTHKPYSSTAAHEESCEATLQRFEWFIAFHAKRFLYEDAMGTRSTVTGIDSDELIQRVRIKFWRTLEKRHVVSPYSYIKHIIYSEFIDMKRRQKLLLPLPIDEDGDEHWCQALPHLTKDTVDPADIVEQDLETSACLEEMITKVLVLPTRQRLAMICSLKDRVDDLVALTDAFKKHRTDIEPLYWPSGKREKQVLQASLSVARRALARSIGDRRNQK